MVATYAKNSDAPTTAPVRGYLILTPNRYPRQMHAVGIRMNNASALSKAIRNQPFWQDWLAWLRLVDRKIGWY